MALLLLKIRREYAKWNFPSCEERETKGMTARRDWAHTYIDARSEFARGSLESLRRHMGTVLKWIDELMGSDMEGMTRVSMKQLWQEIWVIGASIQWGRSTLEMWGVDLLDL